MDAFGSQRIGQVASRAFRDCFQCAFERCRASTQHAEAFRWGQPPTIGHVVNASSSVPGLIM